MVQSTYQVSKSIPTGKTGRNTCRIAEYATSCVRVYVNPRAPQNDGTPMRSFWSPSAITLRSLGATSVPLASCRHEAVFFVVNVQPTYSSGGHQSQGLTKRASPVAQERAGLSTTAGGQTPGNPDTPTGTCASTKPRRVWSHTMRCGDVT